MTVRRVRVDIIKPRRLWVLKAASPLVRGDPQVTGRREERTPLSSLLPPSALPPSSFGRPPTLRATPRPLNADVRQSAGRRVFDVRQGALWLPERSVQRRGADQRTDPTKDGRRQSQFGAPQHRRRLALQGGSARPPRPPSPSHRGGPRCPSQAVRAQLRGGAGHQHRLRRRGRDPWPGLCSAAARWVPRGAGRGRAAAPDAASPGAAGHEDPRDDACLQDPRPAPGGGGAGRCCLLDVSLFGKRRELALCQAPGAPSQAGRLPHGRRHPESHGCCSPFPGLRDTRTPHLTSFGQPLSVACIYIPSPDHPHLGIPCVAGMLLNIRGRVRRRPGSRHAGVSAVNPL